MYPTANPQQTNDDANNKRSLLLGKVPYGQVSSVVVSTFGGGDDVVKRDQSSSLIKKRIETRGHGHTRTFLICGLVHGAGWPGGGVSPAVSQSLNQANR